MTSPEIIQDRILTEVNIATVRFLQAKSFIMNYKSNLKDDIIDVPTALNDFLALHDVVKPSKFIIYPDIELNESQINSIKSYFEFSIPFCEAILSLVNSTVFLKFDAPYVLDIGLPYTNISNQAGVDGYFSFKKFMIQVPLRIKKGFSASSNNFIFSDPDIYILETNISNAHQDVIEALKDSILCFKNELYRPAVTMLGKAVEGAWIELGLSMLKLVEHKKPDYQKVVEKFKGKDDFVWKLDQTIKLYNRQDWFEDITKQSGIKPTHLSEIFYWTEVVRDSRNAIHFGVEPTVPNSFDKASILLMLAVKYLRTIYKLKHDIDQQIIISWL